MSVGIQETPNPDSMKFIPEQKYMSASVCSKIVLIDGVDDVFAGDDFISVTKCAAAKWDDLVQQIKDVFVGNLAADGEPSIEKNDECDEQFLEKDAEIVCKIKELIKDYITPVVARDGGYIKFRGYRDGVVFVELQGACAGCPGASMTLKHGVHSVLRAYLPQILDVEAV